MQQVYNILIATVLSFFIIIGWNLFFDSSEEKKVNVVHKKVVKKNYKTSESVLDENRVIFDSPKLKGSISLKGLLFDDLSLKNYVSDDHRDRKSVV